MSIPGVPPPNPLYVLYESLQVAIATGASVVRFQDRTIEYRSTDDMIKAANYLYMKLAAMGAIPGVNGLNRQIRFRTDKGL